MPKIIENVKQNILKTSREIIEKDGFDSFTIRQVASITGYGVGTIYNYYSSKLSILAALLSEEWAEEERQLKAKIEKSPTFRDSIKNIYDQIALFLQKHRDLFFSINIPAEIKDKMNYGHKFFLANIEKYVLQAQNKFSLYSEEKDRFAACIILIQGPSIYETEFDSIYSSIEKLLVGGK